jgi:4-diphosphocytidyl-2-C-methyl-D-erythritol kinase
MGAWCLPAFAKINLGLRIFGKRNDGYHELETFFLQVGLADRLFFEKISDVNSPERPNKSGLHLTCNKADLPVDASNLCYHAHQLMSEAAGWPLNIWLHLEKNIPVGAGLGGGSSDAAVTLIALNCLFNLGWSESKLHSGAVGF